jgi:hypothetical protein
MTTTPETTTPEAPAAPPEETGEGTPPGEPESGAHSREAANYRRRLHDVEAERDGLRGRVDQLERAEVERVAAEAPYYMIQPGGLWAIGVELAELRRDDGTLDPALVKAKSLLAGLRERRLAARSDVTLGELADECWRPGVAASATAHSPTTRAR